MSSPKVRNQSSERIANSEKEPEKCGLGRVSRLPTPARSPSVSGPRNKTSGRPGVAMQSQMHENSRLVTTVASEETNVEKTSPIASGRRPTAKIVASVSHTPTAMTTAKAKSSTTSGGNSVMLKRQMETQFAMKKKRYASLRKELTDRQKNASELYEEMSQLRSKLIASGAKDPGKIETMIIPDLPTIDKCEPRSAGDSHAFRGSGEQAFAPNSAITGELVSTLEAKLRELPHRRFDVCRDLLQNRSDILQRLAEFIQTNDESKIDGEIAHRLVVYHKESSELETRLEELKKIENETTNEIVQNISALWNEVESSRRRIRELENAIDVTTKELRRNVETATREKKIAAERSDNLQERKQTLETELSKLRTKMRTMEARANDDETKIVGLQSTVKNLESQLKQKESGSDQRLKEMQKSLKNSESLLAKTEKQRDNFESRVNELRKDLASKESEAEKKIKELSTKLDAANAKFDKSIENHKRQAGQFASDEQQIGAQLAVRDRKIATLEREKDEIISVIHRELSVEDNGFFRSIIQKIDVDGDSHDTLVSVLAKNLQDIRTNVKQTRDANLQLQDQLLDLHLRAEAQSNESGKGKSVWSSQVNELRQEISDLRCSVAELTRKNEELEIQLNQKQLQFEEQERAMREQRRVLKVRDEVIGLLKEKPDARTSCEGGHVAIAKRKNFRDREQVDKQIAERTENLQQLYTTLEAKQMQITRLEQIVQKMEIQQDRAQEQRTRLEKKIGQLQLAIHNKTKNHRYVTTDANPVSSTKSSIVPPREFPPDKRSLQNFPPPTITRPLSHSRPLTSRSPLRHPQIQRSKTLNSIQLKPPPAPAREYAFRIIDEVARTLKRERDYDNRKRSLRDQRHAPRDNRAIDFPDEKIVDDSGMSKEELHESLYNWLVQPWMFDGESSNLENSSNRPRRSRCPNVRTTSSEISVIAGREDPETRIVGDNAIDCSRESRCDSPGCRRRSVPDWNYATNPTRARTNLPENHVSRSRGQRS